MTLKLTAQNALFESRLLLYVEWNVFSLYCLFRRLFGYLLIKTKSVQGFSSLMISRLPRWFRPVNDFDGPNKALSELLRRFRCRLGQWNPSQTITSLRYIDSQGIVRPLFGSNLFDMTVKWLLYWFRHFRLNLALPSLKWLFNRPRQWKRLRPLTACFGSMVQAI